MSEQPNYRFIETIIIIGLYTIFPFLLLSFFSQPSIDDFEYAVRDNQNSFLATQIETYYNWSGRYFSTAISRINPIRFGSWVGYKAGSFSLLLIFILTLHFFISALFDKISSKQKIALTAFFTILYFAQIPDISRAFYYITHSFVYILPGILTFVLLLSLSKLLNSKDKTANFIYLIVTTITCIAIVGSNELSLVYIMTSLAFLLFQLWRQKHQALNYILIVFFCSLTASLVMVLAPGNYVRMGSSSGDTGNFLWSVLASLILIPTYFYKWGVLLTVASILYILLWQRMSANMISFNKAFSLPLGLSLTTFLVTLFLMNFAYTWSVGAVPKPNVENVIYFYFVLGWFYNLHVASMRFHGQFQQARIGSVFTVAVMLLFVRLVFNIDNNISSAYLDLLSGKAARHNKELNERYTFLRTSGCDSCVVKPLSGMPKSLYIYDITHYIPGTESPANIATKRYWDKEIIYLSKPGPTGPPIEEENLETLHSIGRTIKHNFLGTGK